MKTFPTEPKLSMKMVTQKSRIADNHILTTS